MHSQEAQVSDSWRRIDSKQADYNRFKVIIIQRKKISQRRIYCLWLILYDFCSQKRELKYLTPCLLHSLIQIFIILSNYCPRVSIRCNRLLIFRYSSQYLACVKDYKNLLVGKSHKWHIRYNINQIHIS